MNYGANSSRHWLLYFKYRLRPVLGSVVMAAQSSDSCWYDLEAAGKFWEPYKGDFWGCLEHLTVVGGFGGILRAVGVHG